MPISKKVGGVYQEAKSVFVKRGGAWVEAVEGYVKRGGVWVKVWPEWTGPAEPAAGAVEYIVVGGGGPGLARSTSDGSVNHFQSGAGGAGQVLRGYLPVTRGVPYPVTINLQYTAGLTAPATGTNRSGAPCSFATVTARGGYGNTTWDGSAGESYPYYNGNLTFTRAPDNFGAGGAGYSGSGYGTNSREGGVGFTHEMLDAWQHGTLHNGHYYVAGGGGGWDAGGSIGGGGRGWPWARTALPGRGVDGTGGGGGLGMNYTGGMYQEITWGQYGGTGFVMLRQRINEPAASVTGGSMREIGIYRYYLFTGSGSITF